MRSEDLNTLPWNKASFLSHEVSINKLMLVFHVDHEFCHNIVKVAVDPRGDSQVDPQTTLTML